MGYHPIGAHMTLQASLSKLGTLRDIKAWRQVEDTEPEFAETVKEIVKEGGTEQDVYRYMLDHTGNPDIAKFYRSVVRGRIAEIRKG
jgi:hypothetical protein